MNFTWLNSIFNGFLAFIPRPEIVRATHAGVKWRWGYKVIELRPGWRWYWPLTTDTEIIVVARQTHKIAQPQAVETRDGISLAVGALIVYSINDVVKAIGCRNWDCDSTLNDIAESAVVHVINKYDYAYIQEHLCNGIEQELTEMCKKELTKYGILVHQVKIADFARTEVKMLFGMSRVFGQEEED